MARSKAQYENEIRTIIVGKLGSELRRAKILQAIVDRAMNDNFVAFEDFIQPEKSNSLSPRKDDEWLLDTDNLFVSVDMEDGFPVNATAKVVLKLGINYKYYYLSHKTPKKLWWPGGLDNEKGRGLQDWISQKIRMGSDDFYWTDPRNGDQYDITSPDDVKAIAKASFVIARSIAKNGHTKRDFAKPFDKMDSVLRNAMVKVRERVAQLYQQATIEAIEEIYTDII